MVPTSWATGGPAMPPHYLRVDRARGDACAVVIVLEASNEEAEELKHL
jgi:hypothetical protein